MRFVWLPLCWMLAAASPVQAIYLSESGGVARLSGTFERGDEVTFAKFLAQPRRVPLRVLWLDSHGGALPPALAIGWLVKKARLTTAVDATRGVCDSACTMIFVAGAKRHYVNGQKVFEGMSSQSGLGFHSANMRGVGGAPSIKSDAGTALLFEYYRRIGAAAAIELSQRAAIDTVFRPNGATALRLRIATSLAPP